MATVNEILQHKGVDVVSVGAERTVLEAANVMNERGIGGVVVIEGDQVIGIFTERDVLRRVVGNQGDPATTQVREVMTSPVVQVPPDTKIDACMALMTDRRIRHLPVSDDTGIRGIITTGDILAFRVREHEDTIQHLNAYVHDLR